MSKGVAGILVVAFAAVTAEGGVVSFTQAAVDLVPSTPNVLDVLPGTPAMFNVGVASTGITTFESVGMLIGSFTMGLEMSFVYADSFTNPATGATLPITPMTPLFTWPSDGFVGGTRLVPPTDPTA